MGGNRRVKRTTRYTIDCVKRNLKHPKNLLPELTQKLVFKNVIGQNGSNQTIPFKFTGENLILFAIIRNYSCALEVNRSVNECRLHCFLVLLMVDFGQLRFAMVRHFAV